MSDQILEGDSSSNTPPPPTPNRKRQYWLGIAYGAIPLVIFLISGVLARLSQYGLYGLPGTLIGLIVYLALLVITITYLFNHEKRFIGYGLLTMLLITPVVAVYGCTLILQTGHA
jgi:peptidoglycan/LPS O-acetylase OafA/YrhL